VVMMLMRMFRDTHVLLFEFVDGYNDSLGDNSSEEFRLLSRMVGMETEGEIARGWREWETVQMSCADVLYYWWSDWEGCQRHQKGACELRILRRKL
jgi:hypothetical protein